MANTGQPLRGVLDEFRTALREEIFAAQRSSLSSGVPLTNGRKIGQVGVAFQYAFTIDSVLNVPGDAPGDLIVPGKERLPTTIISTEGLTITISVGIDLGNFVPNARLETDLTFLLRKFIERIEALNAKSNSAGDRISGFEPASGTQDSISLEGLTLSRMLRSVAVWAATQPSSGVLPAQVRLERRGVFPNDLARARELQAEVWTDELVDISDAELPTREAIRRARLRMQSRQWLAGKYNSRFADKPNQTQVNVGAGVVITEAERVKLLERRQRAMLANQGDKSGGPLPEEKR